MEFVFKDDKGFEQKVELKTLSEGSGTLVSADGILEILGYKGNYSASLDHNFVNGLRNKSSWMTAVKPRHITEEKIKYWDIGDIYYFKSVADNRQLQHIEDSWWKVEEVINKLSLEYNNKKSITKVVEDPCKVSGKFPKKIDTNREYEIVMESDENFKQVSFESGALPVAGNLCEYVISGGNNWRNCKVNYVGKDIIVVDTETAFDVVFEIDEVDFRPKDYEKKKAMAAMMKLYEDGMGVEGFCGTLFDKGWREV